MGKRKRTTDRTKNKLNPPLPSSGSMPCSSETDLLYKETSSHLVNSGDLKPPSPAMGTDGTLKLMSANASLAHHHYNLGRSIFLKRSRHHYGYHYSRRNSGSHVSTSTSRGKFAPLRDERLSFKLASQHSTESGHHVETEEKAFNRPERIRSNSLAINVVSPEMVKMACGICQKLLRRKPCFVGNSLSSGELSVVAVLVCGHVYHADCLEQITCVEDQSDPSCPLCSSLSPQTEASRREE